MPRSMMLSATPPDPVIRCYLCPICHSFSSGGGNVTNDVVVVVGYEDLKARR
jgi:hypothetical protein